MSFDDVLFLNSKKQHEKKFRQTIIFIIFIWRFFLRLWNIRTGKAKNIFGGVTFGQRFSPLLDLHQTPAFFNSKFTVFFLLLLVTIGVSCKLYNRRHFFPTLMIEKLLILYFAFLFWTTFQQLFFNNCQIHSIFKKYMQILFF